jgi:hypothetical protein
MARRPRNPYRQRRRTTAQRQNQGRIVAGEQQTITGVDDMSEIFAILGDAAVGKVLKSAVTAGMEPVKKQAKINAGQFKGHHDAEQGHVLSTGRFVVPGFTAQSVKKKAYLSKDKKNSMGRCRCSV